MGQHWLFMECRAPRKLAIFLRFSPRLGNLAQASARLHLSQFPYGQTENTQPATVGLISLANVSDIDTPVC